MKRIITILIACLLVGAGAVAQNGTVQGRMKTSDGFPVEYVSVGLKGTAYGTTTNNKGEYELKNIPKGNYTLTTSFVGLEAKELTIEVKENETVIVPEIVLSENLNQLNEVIVSSGSNKFANKETATVSRLPLKNMENPQVYSVISKELVQEQMVVDYKQALNNVSGSTPVANVNGAPALRMRGFATGSNARNGLSAAGAGIMNIDPVNIERIEALKGPTGTLFGANVVGTYGGLLNRVIKQPFDFFKGEVSYSSGSWGLNRITADINTPVNASKTVLVRLNTSVHKEKGYKDYGDKRNFSIAPSIQYKVNDRLTFNVDMEYGASKRIGVYYLSGDITKSGATNLKDLKLDYYKSYVGNNLYERYTGFSTSAQMNYKISNKWTSSTNYAYCNASQDRTNWLAFTFLNDHSVIRNLGGNRGLPITTQEFQQNVTGDFKIASMRNRIVVGVDVLNYVYSYNGVTSVNYDTIDLNKPELDYTINSMKADAAFAKLGITSSRYEYTSQSAYVSDVLNITPSLMAMISGRMDIYYYKGQYSGTKQTAAPYKQSSFAPKLGLVYQPVKNKVSLFGNYMSGMSNLGPVTQPDGSVLNLKPQEAWQWEAGTKVDVWKNKVSATISYYEILVTNSTRLEVNEKDKLSYTVQDGTQESKGYEIEFIANPFQGLNIIAGFGHNVNKYVNAADALKGKEVTQNPNDMANVWISYRIISGNIKGLGAGVGGNYVSKAWFDAANTFIVPEHTTANATVFYDHPKFRVGVKVDNLTDLKYWDVNGTSNVPRQFIGSVTFKF